VTPKLRVASTAYSHHYDDSLYGPIRDRVVEGPVSRRVLMGDPDGLHDWDQFHMHWPEWTLPDLARHEALIGALHEAGVRILWTQHNLRPHDGDPRWNEVYAAWAGAADTVIHHTSWGMDLARRTWPYRDDTRHRVIPHGHFGNLMADGGTEDRRATEHSLGLRTGVLRLGIIGAPRPAKLVGLAMDAVHASARDDIELLVLSLRPDDAVPPDPRIVGLRYETVPRDEYNRRLRTIDVLVFPFEDGNMLATGTVADALGGGLPSLVSDWPFLTEYLGDAAICYGRTTEDLTRCIDGLDEARLAQLRANAIVRRAQYHWTRVAELHLAVLEELGTTKV
jgi:glycosyltransferase involved in cell wall biosynthesis